MTDLLRQIAGLTGLAEQAIWLAALVFVRVGAMVALLPALGEQMLPLRIRMAAVIGLTMVVGPTQAGGLPLPDGLFAPLAAEAVTGLIFGFSLRLMILALQTAGAIAAQSTSLAQMFAGTGPEPQPIISNVLVLAGLAVFVALGGLVHAASLVVMSYELIPIGELPNPIELAIWEVEQIGKAFALAFSLSAPFVIASLLYNLALGAINRAMPQLMVSFVGAPALTLGGLALLALAAPILLSFWSDAVERALFQPFAG
jgi:flagellar biosynthetic protein FliR